MRAPEPLEPVAVRGPVSADAVVVIPGIMGSRLVETETGRTLWGLDKAVQFGLRWRHRQGLGELALTPQERDGQFGRIVADGLLNTVEWAPILRGIEPYGALVRRVRGVLAHPDALLEFSYDWRLSVLHNADLLAVALRTHLAAWGTHAARPRGPKPSLVVVAHSMGGLVAAAMCARHLDLVPEIRSTVTLGTPFLGAVKAATMLNSGRGTALEHEHLRELARTLPSVHDLLPNYRCVLTDDDGVDQVVALDAGTATALGADPDHFGLAVQGRPFLDPLVLPHHQLVVGAGQRTDQSMRIRDGVVQALPHGYLHDDDDELTRDAIGRPIPVDHTGDGTVFRYSATPLDGMTEVCLGQQHGALARSASAVDIVCGAITRTPSRAALGGPQLPDDAVGLAVPDLATAGEPFTITVDRAFDAVGTSCLVENALDPAGLPVSRPLLVRGDTREQFLATVVLDDPGLYRVAVSAGTDPVTQLVLVQD